MVVNDSKNRVDDGQQQLPDPEDEPEVEGALDKLVPEREDVIKLPSKRLGIFKSL